METGSNLRESVGTAPGSESAVVALAALPPSAERRAALQQALRTGEAEVRAAAAWALGMQASPEDVPALVARLADEDDPLVREKIAWALGRTATPAAVPALRFVAADDTEAPDTRWMAVFALHRLGRGEDVAGLLTRLQARVAQAAALPGLAPDVAEWLTLPEPPVAQLDQVLTGRGWPLAVRQRATACLEELLTLAPEAQVAAAYGFTAEGNLVVRVPVRVAVVPLLLQSETALRPALARLEPAALAALLVLRLAAIVQVTEENKPECMGVILAH